MVNKKLLYNIQYLFDWCGFYSVCHCFYCIQIPKINSRSNWN